LAHTRQELVLAQRTNKKRLSESHLDLGATRPSGVVRQGFARAADVDRHDGLDGLKQRPPAGVVYHVRRALYCKPIRNAWATNPPTA